MFKENKFHEQRTDWVALGEELGIAADTVRKTDKQIQRNLDAAATERAGKMVKGRQRGRKGNKEQMEKKWTEKDDKEWDNIGYNM